MFVFPVHASLRFRFLDIFVELFKMRMQTNRLWFIFDRGLKVLAPTGPQQKKKEGGI